MQGQSCDRSKKSASSHVPLLQKQLSLEHLQHAKPRNSKSQAPQTDLPAKSPLAVRMSGWSVHWRHLDLLPAQQASGQPTNQDPTGPITHPDEDQVDFLCHSERQAAPLTGCPGTERRRLSVHETRTCRPSPLYCLYFLLHTARLSEMIRTHPATTMMLISAAGTPLTASSASSTAVSWRSLQELREVYGSVVCTSEERGKDVRPAERSKPKTLWRTNPREIDHRRLCCFGGEGGLYWLLLGWNGASQDSPSFGSSQACYSYRQPHAKRLRKTHDG